MKYYSEVTKKLYDSIDELENEEKNDNKSVAKEEYEAAMDEAVKAFMKAYDKFVIYEDLKDDDSYEDLCSLLIKLLNVQ